MHAELTTQQAAELLGVSRPFIVEQLEKGNIPFRKVGNASPSFVQRLDGVQTVDGSQAMESLDELAVEAQKAGLGILIVTQFTVVYDACVLYQRRFATFSCISQ